MGENRGVGDDPGIYCGYGSWSNDAGNGGGGSSRSQCMRLIGKIKPL